jgi:diguanylate cyclase (GGDEF)-like protein/PAS domain S-box-containing protein
MVSSELRDVDASAFDVPCIPRSCYPRDFAAQNYPVGVLDARFRFVDANDAFTTEMAISVDDLRGVALSDLWEVSSSDLAVELEERLEEGCTFAIAVRSHASRPASPAATLQILAITEPNGGPIGYGVAVSTERAKREKRRISLAAEGFQLSFDQISVGMMLTGLDGYAIKWNPAMARLLGRPFDAIAETDMLTMIHPDDRNGVIEDAIRLITHESDTYSRETRLLSGDGSSVWVHETASCVFDPDGDPLHYITQFVDIRDRKQAEQDLIESQAKLTFLFDSTPVPIVEIDSSLTVCAANQALSHLLGRDPIGLSINDLLDPDDLVQLIEASAAVVPGTDWIVDFRVNCADGIQRQVRSHSRIHADEDGRFRSATANWHDITDATQREERLRHEASTDPLTGLPHRATFYARLEAALADASTSGGVAVLFVDLDHFKPINDRYGHEAGDHLLCQVARRLRSCVRADDMVARLGGDEFVIMIDGSVPGADPVVIGQRIVERLGHPFATTYGTLAISASVGLATGGPGSEPRDIVHRADLAAYQAKANGRAQLSSAQAGSS